MLRNRRREIRSWRLANYFHSKSGYKLPSRG